MQPGGAAQTRTRAPLAVLFALLGLVAAVACGDASTPTARSTTNSTVTARADAATAPPALVSTTEAATPATLSAEVVGDGDGIRVLRSSVAPGRSRMITIVDDRDVHLRNGGWVLLNDDLTIELFVDPFPPNTLRAWIDIYLTDGGTPVLDADLSIDYDMLAMEHGPFESEPVNLGGGHYLFTVDYIMYGEWDQTVRVRVNGHSFLVPLLLIAAP